MDFTLGQRFTDQASGLMQVGAPPESAPITETYELGKAPLQLSGLNPPNPHIGEPGSIRHEAPAIQRNQATAYGGMSPSADLLAQAPGPKGEARLDGIQEGGLSHP